MNPDTLLFGAAYYSEYLPYDRVEKDMQMMKAAGMNTIRIAESTWSTLEPQDGVYDFTHIDKMLHTAQKYELFVIIGTPTYAIPTWLNRKYTDILALTHHGQELYGRRQNMDITHPGYRFHCKRIIQKLMEHVKDAPNVIGYQIDNETKSYDTAGAHAQTLFVEYLKEKYPNIREFNHEFGLDYWSNRVNTWEDFPDVRGTINQSLAAEYCRFQRRLVADFLKWQIDIVEEYKKPDQFITHNFDFDWSLSHSCGVQPEVDHYQASKPFTIAGCDIYHPSKSDLTGAEITLCGNLTRSLKKDNYLLLETQAQGNIEWLPYKGQLRLQAYSHIANGADSVMYWHWHSLHNAIESYWKGVLSHDFSENATYKEACRIGKEWQQIGSHLKHLKKKNSIAVLIDHHSLTGLMQFPIPTLGKNGYNQVLRWLCDTLYKMNLEFDMVSSYEHDFSAYDFLIVPTLYSASDALLYALDDYVKNGGHLIVTFKSAFSDEQLKIHSDVQPHILKDCLGIHYDQYTYPKNVALRQTAKDGQTAAMHWMELLSPDTAKVLVSYDHPAYREYAAVTCNSYAKGSALYLGCMFEESLLKTILTDFFTKYGLQIPDTVFPIIIKKGTNTFAKELTYLLNYSDQPQQVTYTGKHGTELFSKEAIAPNTTLLLPPWELCIIEEA